MATNISLFIINERVNPVSLSILETLVKDQQSNINLSKKQVVLIKWNLRNYETSKKDWTDLQKRVKAVEINS